MKWQKRSQRRSCLIIMKQGKTKGLTAEYTLITKHTISPIKDTFGNIIGASKDQPEILLSEKRRTKYS